MRRALAALLLALLALPPAATGLPPAQDDAGSGRDALSGWADEVRIRQARQHMGNLTEGDTRDVYAFDVPAGVAIYAGLVAPADVCIELKLPGDAAVHRWCGFHSATYGQVGAYAKAAGVGFVAVDSAVPQPYYVTFDVDEDASVVVAEPVADALLALRRAGSDLAADDAGSGRDAPQRRAEAFHVAPGVVHRADARYPLDEVDAYRFDAALNATFRLSLDGLAFEGLACVDLVAPAGFQHPLGCVGALGDLAGGMPATFRLPEGGGWTLRFTFLSPGPYRFSFTADGSAPAPLAPLLPVLTLP